MVATYSLGTPASNGENVTTSSTDTSAGSVSAHTARKSLKQLRTKNTIGYACTKSTSGKPRRTWTANPCRRSLDDRSGRRALAVIGLLRRLPWRGAATLTQCHAAVKFRAPSNCGLPQRSYRCTRCAKSHSGQLLYQTRLPRCFYVEYRDTSVLPSTPSSAPVHNATLRLAASFPWVSSLVRLPHADHVCCAEEHGTSLVHRRVVHRTEHLCGTSVESTKPDGAWATNTARI